MIFQFLGAGSAFTIDDNFQSNMLVCTDSGEKLFIDCGTDLRWSSAQQSLSYRDIKEVYISHLHADHCGGLEWLGFSARYDPGYEGKPTLYLHESLVEELWQQKLAGSMQYTVEGQGKLEDFFDIVALTDAFLWQGVEFELVKVRHIEGPDISMPCFGLFFTLGEKSIFLTTDTTFDPENLLSYYEKADIIFHDCELLPTPTGVHANYHELKGLPDEIRQKMWLYHYGAEAKPPAIDEGFGGFVSCGQIFNFSKG